MSRLSGSDVRIQYAAVIKALEQRGFQQTDIDKQLQIDNRPRAASDALAVFQWDLLREHSPRRLDAALSAGLSPKELIAAVKYCGSAKKIRALLGCFDPIALPGGGSTSSWAMLLSQEGIDATALLRVLSTDGGSKSFGALKALFDPITLASGRKTTDWAFLISQEGIEAATILKLLSTHGGSQNLNGLKTLFYPVTLVGSRQTTYWELLINVEGIEATALLRLLSTDGGSHKIDVLIGLIKPITLTSGRETTCWAFLISQEGIDAATLLKLLSTHGASNKLQNLKKLFYPVTLAGGRQTTDWALLINIEGVEVADLLRLVSIEGGSRNLEVLIDLFKPVTFASGRQATYSQGLAELGVGVAAVIEVLISSGSKSGVFLAIRDMFLDSNLAWLFHREPEVVAAVMLFAKRQSFRAAHGVLVAQFVKDHKAFFLENKVRCITQLCAVISRVTAKQMADSRLIVQLHGQPDPIKKLANILKVKWCNLSCFKKGKSVVQVEGAVNSQVMVSTAADGAGSGDGSKTGNADSAIVTRERAKSSAHLQASIFAGRSDSRRGSPEVVNMSLDRSPNNQPQKRRIPDSGGEKTRRRLGSDESAGIDYDFAGLASGGEKARRRLGSDESAGIDYDFAAFAGGDELDDLDKYCDEATTAEAASIIRGALGDCSDEELSSQINWAY